MENLLTVKEAAEKLRCHPETVRELLRRGDLEGIKYSSAGRRGVWKISEKAIDAFLNRHTHTLR